MTTEPEATPDENAETAYDIARDIPSRVRTENRPFIANVIARAIADAVTEDRASRAPVGGAGWRPIETAPKGTALDGLRVDIWLEPIPERQALFANPATKGRRLLNAWHVKRPDYTGWRNEGSWNGRELNWRATHWMPLPAAPGTHPAPASPDAEMVGEIVALAKRIKTSLDTWSHDATDNRTAAQACDQLVSDLDDLLSKHGGDR